MVAVEAVKVGGRHIDGWSMLDLSSDDGNNGMGRDVGGEGQRSGSILHVGDGVVVFGGAWEDAAGAGGGVAWEEGSLSML